MKIVRGVAVGAFSLLVAGGAFSAGWKAHPFTKPSALRLRAIVSQARAVKPDIVVIGDSITEFAPITSVCPGALNAGIAGASTAEVVSVAEAVVPIARPRLVILAVGTNDAVRNTPPEMFIRDYRHLREVAGETGARVISMNIPPVGRRVGGGAPAETGAHIPVLNRLLIPFGAADTYAAMKDQDGFLPRTMSDADGVHLSREGYERWHHVLSQACASV